MDIKTELNRHEIIMELLTWFKGKLLRSYGYVPIERLEFYRNWIEAEPTDYLEYLYIEHIEQR
ncbi:MAG: hypothetical protein GY861_25805 [bacterium]|nr:hypothetical protein [bacterium]